MISIECLAFSIDAYICMAHNMKGFDGVFILKWIIKNLLLTDKSPEAILNGRKILLIKFRSIKINV